ncbi:hypothetical protein GC163_16510 [bacterium]|nr:hypothetical protein [bacterium]
MTSSDVEPAEESAANVPHDTRASTLQKVLVFTGIVLGLGVLTAGVAFMVAGRPGIEVAAWATGLCLPPGWLVFLVEPYYRHPREAVYGSLLVSMVRLGCVMAGVLALKAWRPDLPKWVFAACLAVLYMGSLLVETREVLQGLSLRKPRA